MLDVHGQRVGRIIDPEAPASLHEAEELDRAVASLLKPAPGRPRAKAGEYPSFASGAVLDVHLMRAWSPGGLARWFGEQRLQSHQAAARRRGGADGG